MLNSLLPRCFLLLTISTTSPHNLIHGTESVGRLKHNLDLPGLNNILNSSAYFLQMRINLRRLLRLCLDWALTRLNHQHTHMHLHRCDIRNNLSRHVLGNMYFNLFVMLWYSMNGDVLQWHLNLCKSCIVNSFNFFRNRQTLFIIAYFSHKLSPAARTADPNARRNTHDYN